jgi:transposase
MEPRQRRSFTDDYKRQAAALAASSGRSIWSVVMELGLRDSVLRRWADHAAEIARLQRENEQLRMERDILKKRSRSVSRGRVERAHDGSLAATRRSRTDQSAV